jgi:hypothetical protein
MNNQLNNKCYAMEILDCMKCAIQNVFDITN